MNSFCLATITLIIYLTTPSNTSHCESEWYDLENYGVTADRTYYIGCVEQKWNYCPSGKNLLSGLPIVLGMEEATWCLSTTDRIGPEYYKALYREFTDNCFDTIKTRSEDIQHLGALGPNIRALTGERIAVYYKNTCSFVNSLHVHGLKYGKNSEGAPYVDDDGNVYGTTAGDVIEAEGGVWIYIFDVRPWMVDQGISSKMFVYHSHVATMDDIHTGLFGAIIITRKGAETSKYDLKPKDVDREFTTFMVMYDESTSNLFEKNLLKAGIDPTEYDLLSNSDFVESNKMHAVNGYLFGNLVDLEMNECEIVRWYTGSFGDEVDGPHSPHWHGNMLVDSLGDNSDTLVLLPGTTYTATMRVDAAGEWLYHCHVFHHISAGMITTYTVYESERNCKFGKKKKKRRDSSDR